MSKNPAAHDLDVRAFASSAADLEGSEPLAAFRRLASECIGHIGERQVQWRAHGELRVLAGTPEQVWLLLSARCSLPLQCQRCLEPVDIALAIDRSFRFAADEATAASQDEDSEEDVLAISRNFDVLELAEDELLMALPAIPHHDVCPVKLPMAADEPAHPEDVETHPFAVLAGMRARKSS